MSVKKAKRDLIIAYIFEFLTFCEFGLLYPVHIADERIIDIPTKIAAFVLILFAITIFLSLGAHYITLCKRSLRDAYEDDRIDAIINKPSFDPAWLKS